MGYFPLCVNLEGTSVLMVGGGTSLREKLNVLLPFGPNITLFTPEDETNFEGYPNLNILRRSLLEADLTPPPTFVVVADAPQQEKEHISALCQNRGIPVNVVDEPALCSFFFPSLVTRGALTVSVSTGGKSPGAAAYLRRQLEQHIPDQTDAILEWAHGLRQTLRLRYPDADRRLVLRQAIARAFSVNRPLTEEEVSCIVQEQKDVTN